MEFISKKKNSGYSSKVSTYICDMEFAESIAIHLKAVGDINAVKINKHYEMVIFH